MERQIGVVTSIVDGDTIHVNIDGIDYPLRYIGLDSPEIHNGQEFYGPEASEYNRQLVSGKTVILVRDDSETDIYDRLLRYVIVDDLFINYELVRNGYALAKSYPPDTACDGILREAQNQISVSNTGIWSYLSSPSANQDFAAVASETPNAAQSNISACPQGCTEQLPGCAIKGNINNEHEKIYHVPGSTWYSKTKIDAAKGERWFCTIDEAVNNGWRAPYN